MRSMTGRWTGFGAARYWLLLVILVIAAIAVDGSAPVEAAGRRGRDFPAHIVLLEAGAVPGQVARNHGLDIRTEFGGVINGFATTVPAGLMRSLLRDPDVAAVELNLVLQAGPVSTASTITVSAQSIPSGVRRIGADLSKIANIDGIDDRVQVVVAVLDTGVDGSHPDLNVNVARSVDCSSGVSCVSGLAVDDNGHGTHVAGTIGALDNSIGVVGVAPGAEIWSVRVCGSGGGCGLDAILLGHNYISANASEIDVVNVSLGGLGWSAAWRDAIKSNVDLGVPVYVAAGNVNRDIYGYDGAIGNGNEFIPSSYPEAAAISAIVDTDGMAGGAGADTTNGVDDSLAGLSNYAIDIVADNPVISPGGAIDIAAPGVTVLSTFPGEEYGYMSGTSVASSHAAGLAALHIAATLAPTDATGVAALRQTLIDDASPMADWRPDSADVASDQDDNHEPLGTADALIGPTPSDPPPVIDVAVSGVAAAASVIQGDLLQIEVILTNRGDADAVSSVIVTDTTSGQVIHTGSVKVLLGSSLTLQVLWDTSIAMVGEHWIGAEVITLDDADPSNDGGFLTTIVEAAVTDLEIVSIAAPGSAIAGDALQIDVAAENVGNRTVSDAVVLIMSDNATPDAPGDDFVIAERPLAVTFLPGEISAFSVVWDTAEASIGTHVLTARHSVSDDNPSNDAASALTTLDAAVLDLAVTGFTLPASVITGDTSLIEVIVQNIGMVDIGAGVEAIVTSDNATPGAPEDDFVVVVHTLPGLTAGAGASFSFAWNTTGVVPGVHLLTARHGLVDANSANDARTASTDLRSPAPLPEPIEVVVETDRPAYGSRGTVKIAITATKPDGSPAVRGDLTLVITGPTGWSKVVSTTTGKNGVRTFKLKLNANRMGCGTYTVQADVYLDGFPSGSNKTTFQVC